MVRRLCSWRKWRGEPLTAGSVPARPVRVTPWGRICTGATGLPEEESYFWPLFDGDDVRVFPPLPSEVELRPEDSPESFLLFWERWRRCGPDRQEGSLSQNPPPPQYNGVPLDDRCCLTLLTLGAEMAQLSDSPAEDTQGLRSTRTKCTGHCPRPSPVVIYVYLRKSCVNTMN